VDTVPTREGETGAAILTEAFGPTLTAKLSRYHEVGDQLMVVGRVVDAGLLNKAAPAYDGRSTLPEAHLGGLISEP